MQHVNYHALRHFCVIICFICFFVSIDFYNKFFTPFPSPFYGHDLYVTHTFPTIDYCDIGLNMYMFYCSLPLLIVTFCFFLFPFIRVRFVAFNSELSTLTKRKSIELNILPRQVSRTSFGRINLFVILFLLLVNNYETVLLLFDDEMIGFLFNEITLVYSKLASCKRLVKFMFLLFFGIESSFVYADVFCFYILSMWYYICFKCKSKWIPFLLIILANDISKNPGPVTQNYFSFMNWNLNSLAKGNFERVPLLQAHNSIYNYDIISVCETNLTDLIEIPDPLLSEYTFISSNNPLNVSHGGVGLFYKSSLPLKNRSDLSFRESIVVELTFGRKKIFFTVLYRSPSNKYGSEEFNTFSNNLNDLHSKILAECPYAIFYSGDFNCQSSSWWPEGGTNPEGREIDYLFSNLNLSQLIREPTNFTPGKRATCIDLISTNQPNLVLECGTRSSLDPLCHHQITHCKINLKTRPPPPYERKIWHYDRANIDGLKRSMSNFPWHEQLNLNQDVNWQTTFFTETVLNIMSNFIPNEIKKISSRDPPWLDKPLKTLLRKKNRLYKNYKKHGYREEDKIRLDIFRNECKLKVNESRANYLQKLGMEANNPDTSKKTYWKILNKVLNKCKAPKIPPLLVDGTFITNCGDKAKLFNDFFLNQCKPLVNGSVLPPLNILTNSRIDHFEISDEDILSLIRHLNSKKAMGHDGLSSQMLILCDYSIVPPLKIIFQNILKSSVFPDLWKCANVTPIFKKDDKKIIKNY